MDLLIPKEIKVKTQTKGEKTYIISKFPAIAGREIIAKYPLSGLPKIGDYEVNEETMFKLMEYVAVKTDQGEPIRLQTRALIDNHIPDWETLARIEIEMMGYNCSFFQQGKISSFLDTIKANAEQSITSILTDLLGRLSPAAKPNSGNLKKNTP